MRIHLFEFEDQPWFPDVIRDAGTGYLRFMMERTGQARELVPKIREILDRAGTRRIVDLCSGGAGPVPAVVAALAEEGTEVEVTLTDRYPNRPAFERVAKRSGGRIDARSEPIDATAVPADLAGLRTLFNALHHFAPSDAARVLQSAVDARQPVAVFELVSRHPAHLFGILFAFVPVLLVVPFLRPFRWSWLVWTYVVPVIPLFVVWDGLVSCLRVYSKAELASIVEGLEGGEGYVWEQGEVSMPPLPVGALYLVGVPRAGSE